MKLQLRVLCWILLFCLTGMAKAETPTLIVAVVPQFAPTKIQHDWGALLERLEKITGIRFQLRIYNQIPQFEADLAQAIPDLAFMNPYHMVLAKKAHGYRPLVRNSAPLNGILVVRKDSPVKSVQDLNHQNLSFPSPNALGASLYMRALLLEKEGINFQANFVGNHQTVFRDVLIGKSLAGGGVQSTLSKEPAEVQNRLRVLYTTPDLASHPLAVHPRVQKAVAQKIADAIMSLRNDEAGKRLLADVTLPLPVEADFLRDYAALEKLNLQRHYVAVQ